jgi:hypothetical protein
MLEPDTDDGVTPETPPRGGRLRRWYRRRLAAVLYKPDSKNEFPQSKEALEEILRTSDAELAGEILAEAKQISAQLVEDRVDSVERRAATLQGVVAIAATFVLTGGTLLVSQVSSTEWRAVVGAALLFCIGSFALCGIRATQAASQWRTWAIPRRDDILDRSGRTVADVRISRAVGILRVAGLNSSAARWKVTMLRYAVSHLKRALLGLFILAALIVGYAIGHSPSTPTRRTGRVGGFESQGERRGPLSGIPHRFGY